MSEITKAFEEWQKRDDKIIEIAGETYYRIIWKESLRIEKIGREILFAVLHPDISFKQYKFADENGNHFEYNGHIHIRFAGEIPPWHPFPGECILKWEETYEIGDYIRVVESERNINEQN